MPFSDVILDAASRLEGHGATGAFVEQFTMSLLDVRFDRVQSSEHYQATGASAERQRTESNVRGRASTEGDPSRKGGEEASHLYPTRRVKCKHVSSKCV